MSWSELSNMSSSSIPVRKGTRRSIPSDGSTHTSPPNRDIRQTGHSKENKEPDRPVTRQSSKKDLWESNERLREQIKTLEDKQRHMDTLLTRTKSKLENFKAESGKEETRLKDTLEDLSQKYHTLQSKIDTYEKKLLTSQIDPVTLKPLEADNTDGNSMEEKRLQTQVQVSHLTEKLDQNTSMMTDTLTKLKTMNTELDDIITSTDSSLFDDNV